MTFESAHFKMSETGESQNLPECTKKDEMPPPCCTMESEDCHNNSQPNSDGNHGELKKNLKAKGKLVRSTAVCDESLPTEENSKEKDSKKTISSNHGDSPECDEEEEGKSKGGTTTKKPSLSKEPSLEYTDSTGIDLEEFLITTLKSSPRDRLMLLKLEQDMTDFMTDNSSYKKFSQMSSYHRMLVHRVAAYFGLEHNVDHSGKAVIINKTSNSRIPEHRFAEHVQEEKTEERRLILKRNTSQDKEDGQRLRVPSLKEQMRSKSIEEREEEYHRVRDCIFSQDSTCVSQSVYIETRGLEDGNILNETQKRRQLFRGNWGSSGQLSGSRQSSFELDSHWNDPQPWSSTDSDSPTWTSKSTHSSSKLCIPVSESALSYAPPSNSPAYIFVPAESSIPPGSILLNPHTGQPFLNPDGTPAVYNPPVSQKPISNQLNTVQHQAPPPPPQQQPVASHGVPQVQYSSVTYLPSQQSNVSTSQQHPIEQTREDLTSKFAHMTMSPQSSGDLPDMPSYYMQGAPPTHSYAPPHHSYAPSHHSDSYVSPGMTLAPPTAPPPHTHSQQSNQVSVYSYPVQCPGASQQYGAASYSTQTGYPTVISNQQGCPGMMGSPILSQTQQGIMGSYPSVPSYQVPQQQQQQQSYPSTMLGQGGQTQCFVPPAGVQVYCNSLPPSPPPPLSMLGVSFQSSGCKNGCNINQNQFWY
ncbi:cAMP-regulated phosphoprotein 21-like [Myxocyprinus asiaticus]|uniref:cAMP-regulated phosphoprotein 21-like n=1 Tax=Myxocyprinus asiaticus TaxID=70543 RepID=UPI00222293E9|nr:cAMP-regulated phosphoprotein 21-like [Myxocyprinus asiaticus]